MPTVPSWKNTSTVTGGCTSGVPNQRVACGEMWTSSGPCRLPLDQELAIVTQHLPFLLEDDKAWILGRTAMTIWKFAAP